jgi:aryl-alcohol dehydrogenase-like predicted oxidoreductase
MVTHRRLGRSGLEIAPLVLGGNVFGHGGMDRDRSFAVLDAFVDGGGTMIDTADIYANYVPGGVGGESETMIGEWLRERGRRDEVLIATKVGGRMAPGAEGLGAAHIAAGIEASLGRLGTDRVDLYYAHFDDASTPLEETVAVFDALVRQGKVRALGASNYAPDRLAAALDIAAASGATEFTVVQPHYNILERGYEAELAPLVAERDLGVVTYFALAQGYLTGKYRTEADLGQSRRGRGVHRYMEGRGPAVLAVLDRIAAARGEPHAAIALAWVAVKPGVAAPIASATGPEQLAEIMRALAIALTAEEIAALDAAGA